MGSRHSRRLLSLLVFVFIHSLPFLFTLSHTHSRQPLNLWSKPLFNSLKMLAANPPKCPFFLTHSVPVSPFKITCSASSSSAEERSEIRLGLPSKGRMAADTLDLLRDCQLSVKHVNPRQYVAQIPQVHTRSLTHSIINNLFFFVMHRQIYIVGGFCGSCPTWKCGFKGLKTLSGSCFPETWTLALRVSIPSVNMER